MDPREPIARCRVDLKGGGRLDGVAGVVDVRLEPGELQWMRSGPRSVDVEGDVRAYVYVLEKGGRRVSGSGLSIPFRSRFDLPAGVPSDMEVYVDELRSEHDFDPVSQEFQHQVTVVLAIAPRGGSLTSPPAPGTLGSASGETRFSQVRLGERPAGPSGKTEGESRAGEPEMWEHGKGASPRPPEDGAARPPQGPSIAPPGATGGEAKGEGKTLIWKAFPPPIRK